MKGLGAVIAAVESAVGIYEWFIVMNIFKRTIFPLPGSLLRSECPIQNGTRTAFRTGPRNIRANYRASGRVTTLRRARIRFRILTQHIVYEISKFLNNKFAKWNTQRSILLLNLLELLLFARDTGS